MFLLLCISDLIYYCHYDMDYDVVASGEREYVSVFVVVERESLLLMLIEMYMFL